MHHCETLPDKELLHSLRIAVIYAGDKREPGAVFRPTHNTRSWKSYQRVAEEIATSLFRNGVPFVSVIPENAHLIDALRKSKINFAWINTGGVQGNDSIAHASAILEMLGIPYVGHTPSNAIALDRKDLFKLIMTYHGIPVPPWLVFDRGESPEKLKLLEGRGPFVVKPVSGRASLDVSFVPDLDQLHPTIIDVQTRTQSRILIEEFLDGDEFCVSALASQNGVVTKRGPQTVSEGNVLVFSQLKRLLDVDERIFTSMDTRPISPDRLAFVEDPEVLSVLNDLARRVAVCLGINGLIRLDVRASQNGTLYVLEANPKPDLKRPENGITNLTTFGLDQIGMSYDDLIFSIMATSLHATTVRSV